MRYDPLETVNDACQLQSSWLGTFRNFPKWLMCAIIGHLRRGHCTPTAHPQIGHFWRAKNPTKPILCNVIRKEEIGRRNAWNSIICVYVLWFGALEWFGLQWFGFFMPVWARRRISIALLSSFGLFRNLEVCKQKLSECPWPRKAGISFHPLWGIYFDIWRLFLARHNRSGDRW